jgi:hypothetical protein
MKVFGIGLVVSIILTASTAAAFNGHIVTQGPLKLTIGNIEDVTEYNKPRDVKVTVKNNGDSPLQVQLRMADLVDEWYAVGETENALQLRPAAKQKLLFE